MTSGSGSTFAAPELLLALALLLACGDEPAKLELRVVTFNTGGGAGGEPDHPDGFTEVEADYSDEHYGNGLAWIPAIEATRAFFDEARPDVVAFQEIFHPEECVAIPEEARVGFVCETWAEGDPFVTQRVLGEGYQIACNLEKSDKCIAVRRAFGRIRGCEADVCLDHLGGGRVMDCGGGSRVGQAEIELLDDDGQPTGDVLTVVGVHGSSGFTVDDMACRERQFDQVWIDLLDGTGEPGVRGALNVVMGDFNTDPERARRIDSSARRLNELVAMFGYAFITEVGLDAPGTYHGAVDIDHVLSDAFEGSCTAPGVTEGTSRVYEPSYFDHVPIVCDLAER